MFKVLGGGWTLRIKGAGREVPAVSGVEVGGHGRLPGGGGGLAEPEGG